MSTTSVDSLAALLWLLAAASVVIVYLWTALALASMFRKMGEEPWRAWVPVLNQATVLAWGGLSPWLILLGFVPGVGTLAVVVLQAVAAHRINPGFGHGAAMTAVAALAFPVWASVLGFGSSRWLGRRPVPRPRERRPQPAAPVPLPERLAATPEPPAREVAESGPAPGAGAAGTSSAPGAGDVTGTGSAPAPDAAAIGHASRAPDGWDVPVDTDAPIGTYAPAPSAAPSDAPAGAGPAGGPDAPDADPGMPPPAAPESWAPPPASAGPPHAGSSPVPAEALMAGRAPQSPASAAPPASADAPVGPPSAPADPVASPPGHAAGAEPPSSSGAVPAVRMLPLPPPETPISVVPGRVPPASAGPVAPPSTLPLIVPPPSGSPAEPAPPADAPMWQAPVREVPAAVVRPHRELWAPPPDPDAPDLFPEQSVEISAVVGSPAAGAPITAVEAMLDGDDLDQTVVVSRRRAWQLLPASGPPIALVADVVILGRQPDAQQAFPGAQLVALDDRTRTVSKTHARLERHGDGWRVVDLHSTNGVVVTAADGADAEIAPDAAVPVRERFVLGDVELRLVRLAR